MRAALLFGAIYSFSGIPVEGLLDEGFQLGALWWETFICGLEQAFHTLNPHQWSVSFRPCILH